MCSLASLFIRVTHFSFLQVSSIKFYCTSCFSYSVQMHSCDSWNKALAAVVSTHLLNFCCLSNFKQGVRVKRRRVACLANDQVTTAIAGVVRKIWCKVQTFIGLQRERGRERERDDLRKHAMLGVRISIFFSTFHFNLFSFRIKPFSLAECALFFPLHHFQQVFNSTPPDCR